MKRLQCSNCTYPLTTCVCKYLQEPIKNRTRIIILQHPDETELAKNTVRLLTLQLSNIEVFVGESQQDFMQLQSQLNLATCALLYPSEHAVTTDALSDSEHIIETLLVIDGTWKKTNKILALNTWLKTLLAVSFKDIPQNKYTIRKAEQIYSLSTLEAVGLFLTHQEQVDSQPLLLLLDGMIEEQTKFMPAHVKARYQR
ncbi:DTW domain-containing protein [Pseudoalteromonas sp. MSK9-3]|uniref:tRNA-uridine aminocarboxypropyltransferase n=1 Tax=Pseudoalteromonas sp. MSK9-3 TaxID=1897633 RepID=UPI000E6CC856|nr:tRNA-uridine aminocarboxypropyltransferase [Pseudoalteromonas sp. MSK9-3]RJE78072.1 DTW domain-containing protein [Pseudoalteromonas sp. MSK9-3]